VDKERGCALLACGCVALGACGSENRHLRHPVEGENFAPADGPEFHEPLPPQTMRTCRCPVRRPTVREAFSSAPRGGAVHNFDLFWGGFVSFHFFPRVVIFLPFRSCQTVHRPCRWGGFTGPAGGVGSPALPVGGCGTALTDRYGQQGAATVRSPLRSPDLPATRSYAALG
jgi:hypothetical protein